MNKMLTTQEAADALGVTAGRIRQMVIDGTLNADKFGSNLAINAESVELARNRKTKPGPMPQATPTETPIAAAETKATAKKAKPAAAVKSKTKKARKRVVGTRPAKKRAAKKVGN